MPTCALVLQTPPRTSTGNGLEPDAGGAAPGNDRAGREAERPRRIRRHRSLVEGRGRPAPRRSAPRSGKDGDGAALHRTVDLAGETVLLHIGGEFLHAVRKGALLGVDRIDAPWFSVTPNRMTWRGGRLALDERNVCR